jgi:cytochrome oxidase Cu insertion factor (SCO1/SenC/PrrC family)
MLKFRSSVGLIITVLILILIGFSYWAQPTQTSSLSDDPETAPPPIRDDIFVGDEIVPPVPVPDFDLVNHNEQRVSNDDLKGRVVLLGFAYTACPDTCPVLFGRYLSLQQTFAEAIGKDVELAFISVDPEVDTPERLKLHTEVMAGQWYFLTEEMPVMEEIWKAFRVRVEKDGNLVGHSNLTYLIDEHGLMRVRYIGLPPDSVLAGDIEKLLNEG